MPRYTAARLCNNLAFLAFICVYAIQSHAANLNLDLPQVELVPASMGKSYDLDFGIQDEKFSASETQLNGYNNFTEAKLRAKGQASFGGARFYADLGASYSLNVSSYGTGYVPELYFSYSGQNFELSLGRRFINWNTLDSYWQLGLWQTQFKWNYVQPVEQGLFGVNFDLHTSDWKLMAYASPLFVPEQSAPFTLSNGLVSSPSPWFSPPAKYVQLFSGRANINYNLETPSTSSVVSQFSYGGAIQWNPKPFSIKISYVYKPRNTLALPVDGYLALQPGGSNAPVYIYPRVIFHQLASLDLNYQVKDFSIWFSGLSETQDKQNYESNLTYQILSNQVLLSPGFEWQPFASLYSPRIGASYLYQSGGDVSEVGTLSSAGSSIFSYPINFRNASQLRIAQPILRASDQRLDFNVKWIEEFHDPSSLLMLELNYQLKTYNFYLGADLLGSGAPASNSGFLPRYRDNSFAYAGAKLHF